jgi:hypothetical protein
VHGLAERLAMLEQNVQALAQRSPSPDDIQSIIETINQAQAAGRQGRHGHLQPAALVDAEAQCTAAPAAAAPAVCDPVTPGQALASSSREALEAEMRIATAAFDATRFAEVNCQVS